MDLRHILSLSAIAALGFALLPGSAPAQQKSLKDQLVGTWNVVAWERTDPDGKKVHAFGTNPKGVTSFGADGRFFLFFTRADLQKLKSNDRTQATPQEAQTIYTGMIAYHGTYTLDEASKTLTYSIENTTFPNQLGMQQKRVTARSRPMN